MQPVIIEDNISIAAGVTNQNVIASNPALARYLRCPWAAGGQFMAVISAAGLVVNVDHGDRNVVADTMPRVGTDLQEPIDVINGDWFAEKGEQLVVRVANPTAGALSIRYRITLINLADMGITELPPDCQVMGQNLSIAAAVDSFDVLAGTKLQRPVKDSFLEIFATASAAGLTRQVYVEQTNVAPPSAIAPLNRMPQDPFDRNVEGVQVPRDNNVALQVSNPTGGALTFFWRVKFRNLVR